MTEDIMSKTDETILAIDWFEHDESELIDLIMYGMDTDDIIKEIEEAVKDKVLVGLRRYIEDLEDKIDTAYHTPDYLDVYKRWMEGL
jgi:predicted SpoU family rRNA methylase